MNVTLHKICQLGVTGAAIFCIGILQSGCDKFLDHPFGGKNPKGLKDYNQVNLVGNNDEYKPAHVDPHLINAWGIAFSASGIAWISSQEGHVSVVYDRDGNMLAARPEVAIPSPGGATGGNPTGQVVNMDTSTADFHLSNNATARFIFVGIDGVVSGWNGAAGNAALVIQAKAGSVYTGVTMAQNDAKDWHLYAANFATGKIDVWDKNFASVNLPFNDPDLPAGYAPFNIQNVGGKLFVLYAKVGSDGDEEKGAGKGFVDVYDANGMLENRFASREQLNAPWGVAQAPDTFFNDENGQSQPAILIGNFGDGHINAYTLKGKFMGQLRAHGNPIEIEGLWALMFPPATSTIDPNRLYFAAGPDDEKEGLFGYITK